MLRDEVCETRQFIKVLSFRPEDTLVTSIAGGGLGNGVVTYREGQGRHGICQKVYTACDRQGS